MFVCKNCLKEFVKISPKGFCSIKCAATYTNKNRGPRKHSWLKGCKNCGTPIPSYQKYCNLTCRREHTSKTPEQLRARKVIEVTKWRHRVKQRAVEFKGG